MVWVKSLSQHKRNIQEELAALFTGTILVENVLTVQPFPLSLCFDCRIGAIVFEKDFTVHLFPVDVRPRIYFRPSHSSITRFTCPNRSLIDACLVAMLRPNLPIEIELACPLPKVFPAFISLSPSLSKASIVEWKVFHKRNWSARVPPHQFVLSVMGSEPNQQPQQQARAVQ